MPPCVLEMHWKGTGPSSVNSATTMWRMVHAYFDRSVMPHATMWLLVLDLLLAILIMAASVYLPRVETIS